ncbi:sensor histidine kinase [Salirhabdus sp. Marseille-P4669]|uniref:sensor histidine kinase n=1 Tax=Salirhabdus sp. Marseille-P4669 TaxID=2042310 RepID=UPI000C7E0ED6|nr:HAMP domain-containing sensor histidine kinase [Salirhabdus sp. Marseille-P4669]
MLYLLILAILLVVYQTIRLLSLKSEMKKLGRQLHDYNSQITNKKIDMALLDQHFEKVGMEINRLIDKYVKANRERIRTEDELKQMIANMSHDLRTPLTSIVGYIQMAESEAISEEERNQYISIAKKRANRLESLLHDFFELSVIESAEYQLNMERVNLKNVIVDVLMTFYDRFQAKRLEPVMNIPDWDVFIMADKSAVTRVIENLIANASKYATNNSIVISMEEKKSGVRFCIQNEAHHLTEKDVKLLFERFYIADQSRTGKSTGLGLSIVRSLMEKMDGRVAGELNNGQLRIICEWKCC